MIQKHRNKSPILGQNVYVAPNASVIGDVTLNEGVSVWPSAVLRGDYTTIVVGAFSNIQDGAVLHGEPDYPVHIGQYVTIGHLAHVHGATIHDYALIGSGSIVLDGAIVESYAQVAAGALVPPNKRLVSGFLYGGIPAKEMRELRSEERQLIEENARHYVSEGRLFLDEAAEDADLNS
jgi:carbonic anhydrase/acetyltransferase-like protein (isoleucine patch superfamily)